jgi:hypothetical protein
VDRQIISGYLAQAEQRVADGESRMVRQRGLIAQLERVRRDATAARQPLATFENAQAMHVANRFRLQRQLAAAGR